MQVPRGLLQRQHAIEGVHRGSRQAAVAPAVDGVVVEAPVWADAHGGQLVQVHQAADECDRALAITAGLFDRVAHVGFRAGFGIQENIGDGLVMRIKDPQTPRFRFLRRQ